MNESTEESNSPDTKKTPLCDDLLRTMRITTNSRFEAAKRLKRINSICFLSTTLASLGLILIPLLDLAGHNKVFSSETLTVVQIFLAVCVLVYSSAISTANYSGRSNDFLQCGDSIKKLVNNFKHDMLNIKEDEKGLLKKYNKLYAKSLKGTENHEDIDYLRALNLYNKKQNISEEVKKGEIISVLTFPYKKKEFITSFFILYMPFLFLMLLEIVFIGDMIGYWGVLDKFHSVQKVPSFQYYINEIF